MSGQSSHSRVLHSSDGCEIFAEATGDPESPHVVLIHGITLSGAVFDDFCRQPELLKELYIVRYDLRGHGRSGGPEALEAHQSKLYADDFMAVVRGFGLNKPVLVGWSVGGTIAVDLCANVDPLPISGVFYLSSVLSIPAVFSGAGTPFLMTQLGACSDPATTTAGLLGLVAGCFDAPRTRPPSYHLRCLVAGMQAMQSAAVRASILQRIQDTEKFWKKLEQGLPVFVYHGSHDALTDAGALVRDVKRRASNVGVKIVEGAGHVLFYEDPQETARVILDFVKSVQRQTPELVK